MYSATRHGLSENARPLLTPTIANAGFDGSAWEHCGHEMSKPPVTVCEGGTVVVVVDVVEVDVVVVDGWWWSTSWWTS